MKTLRSFIVIACALLVVVPLGAQPRDVRININSGQGKRIRVFCQSFDASGDRDSRAGAVTAEDVLANDLDNSAVFIVSRAWRTGDQSSDVQAVVGGKWILNGSQIRL